MERVYISILSSCFGTLYGPVEDSTLRIACMQQEKGACLQSPSETVQRPPVSSIDVAEHREGNCTDDQAPEAF